MKKRVAVELDLSCLEGEHGVKSAVATAKCPLCTTLRYSSVK